MKVSIGPMTIAEIDRIADDGNRYELIDGELYVSAAPRDKHQMVSSALLRFLLPHVHRKRLGRVYHAPYDVYLEPGKQTRVEPDILFISRDRLGIIKEEGAFGAPDLVIEILSESTSRADKFDKRDLYSRAGVREYWIVDPDGRYALVYRFAEAELPREFQPGDTITSDLLPGLEIPLNDILTE